MTNHHEEHEGHGAPAGESLRVLRVLRGERNRQDPENDDMKGILFELRKPMPVESKGNLIDCGCRLDLLVDGKIIVDLKAVIRLERPSTHNPEP